MVYDPKQLTPEHQFLSESIDKIVREFSQTSLLGVLEANRKKFDHACILQRDMNRSMISQVLWNNFEGIEKDLRTLLHDREAKLKLYVFKDSNRSRAKIAEIVESYKNDIDTAHLLRGLRLFPLPGDFDADFEDQQRNLYNQLRLSLGNDIIFNILFGVFRRFDLDVFLNHGGPYGLKFAILDEVTRNGLFHHPTFKEALGYSTSGPIRECLIMLNSIGLIKNISGSNVYLPTIKGRLLLDLSKKLAYEYLQNTEWTTELSLIFKTLNVDLQEVLALQVKHPLLAPGPVKRLLDAFFFTKSIFRRDLLANVDMANPNFHNENFLMEIKEKLMPQIGQQDFNLFSDENSLLFADDFY